MDDDSEENDELEASVIDNTEAQKRRTLEEDMSDEDKVNEIELFTELGERSLLFEKMEIQEEDDLKTQVEELINTFDVPVEGLVERSVIVRTRKGLNTVLVEFDSSYYRDSVLRQSRTSR